MYKLGLILLVSYVCASTPPPCPPNAKHCQQPGKSCICTFEYKPVCGDDGKTYPNQCSLDCAKAKHPGLKKKHDGPCKNAEPSGHKTKRSEPAKPSCVCTKDRRPVCGSDGVTYSNICLLECAAKSHPGLKKKHDGPCKHAEHSGHKTKRSEPAKPSCACPKDRRPVCGSDGVTYPNQCALDCAKAEHPGLNLKKKYDGPCKKAEPSGHKTKRSEPAKPSCVCTKERKPVCGSDGVTYDNNCLLECAAKSHPGLKKKHDGPCKHAEHSGHKAKRHEPAQPSCICSLIVEPVCGSDGVTYNNNCYLKCAAKAHPGLKKKHDGPCKA